MIGIVGLSQFQNIHKKVSSQLRGRMDKGVSVICNNLVLDLSLSDYALDQLPLDLMKLKLQPKLGLIATLVDYYIVHES